MLLLLVVALLVLPACGYVDRKHKQEGYLQGEYHYGWQQEE